MSTQKQIRLADVHHYMSVAASENPSDGRLSELAEEFYSKLPDCDCVEPESKPEITPYYTPGQEDGDLSCMVFMRQTEEGKDVVEETVYGKVADYIASLIEGNPKHLKAIERRLSHDIQS